MFIGALFIITKTWKQLICPSTDEWIKKMWYMYTIESVQLLSSVWLFVTPWTATLQASLFITNSQSLLKLMSIEFGLMFMWCCYPTISSPVIPFSSCLQSFSTSGSFPMSQFFSSGSQTIGVSASASILPMNIQDWFSLGLMGWISLQYKGLSMEYYSPYKKIRLVQK